MKIHNIFVVDEISNEDTRFLKVEIDVLHTGLNFNKSIFEKDIVNECVDTIKNTPIVGYISNSNNSSDFEGHEYKLSRTENGIEYVYSGNAYGVIPESCNPRWVTRLCDDGEEREFLRVDGVLWRKFEDASDIFIRDVVKQHSMEIEFNSVEGYEDEDGVYHFTKFAFEGCCILGDDKEPAMINSKIELNYTVDEFIKNVQSELINKYNTYTKLLSEKNSKGGITTMSKNKDFSLSINQRLEELKKIVSSQETITDEYDYTYSRYNLIDVQDNEVVVVDYKDSNFYGFSYVEDGDGVKIDFSSGVRKKITYDNYVDGTSSNEEEVSEVTFNLEDVISEFKTYYQNKIKEFENSLSEITSQKDEVTNNYNEVKEKLDEIEPKYNDFVVAEQKRINDEIKAEKDSVIKDFETHLSDVEEFQTIKDSIDELSLEEIENKCSVLYTKKNLQTNFSKQPKQDSLALPDINDDEDSNVYSSSRYGNITLNK